MERRSAEIACHLIRLFRRPISKNMAQAQTTPKLPDPGEQLAALQRIAVRSQRVAELWLGGKRNGGSAHAGPAASMTLAQVWPRVKPPASTSSSPSIPVVALS